MKPTDVLLVFSVWPCTKRTIQVGKLCHQLGIPIILVTNTSLNPLAKAADVMIDAIQSITPVGTPPDGSDRGSGS